MTNQIKSLRNTSLDFLKGVLVIRLILMHIHYEYDKGCMPEFITLPYYMPLFCFVSGIFIKDQPLGEVIQKKSKTLLIPFITFYVFSLLLYKLHAFQQFMIEGETLSQSFIQTFTKNTVYSYQILNGSLWFFIGLFCMTILYTLFKKCMNNFAIITLSLILSLVGLFLWARPQYNIVTNLFPLFQILYYLVYVTLGGLYGKKLLKLIENGWQKWLLLLCAIPICLINLFYEHCSWMHVIPYMAWQMFCSMCFIACAVLLIRYVDKIKVLHIFRFYGRNSLILFATHMPIFALYYTEWFKVNIYLKIVFFVAFLILEYLIILFFNHICPRLIGKPVHPLSNVNS